MNTTKKLLTIMLTVLTVSVCAIGHAMVLEKQASVGGVAVEMDIRQAEAVLGRQYAKTKIAPNRYSYAYRNGLYIETAGNTITYLRCDRNNGVATVDGLAVGSTMGQVEDVLGRADIVNGNMHVYQASGQKDIAFVYTRDKHVARIFSGLSFEEEEAIRRENNKKTQRHTDPGNEAVRRSRQIRDTFWNLRRVFDKRYRHHGWWW